MARIDNLTNFVTDVASAIRERTNTSGNISCSDFDTKIQNIPHKCQIIEEEGEVISLENSRYLEIPHGLGVVPQFARIWSDEVEDSSYISPEYTMGEQRAYKNILYVGDYCMYGKYLNKNAHTFNTLTTGTDMYFSNSMVKGNSGSATRYFLEGITYKYYVMAGIEFED